VSELLDIYKRDIKPRLDLAKLLAPLRPRKVGGNYYLTCPDCGEKTAFIKEGWDVIACNRANGCNMHMGLLTYLNGGTVPKGQAWAALIKRLAAEVNVEIPEKNWTPEQIEKIEKRRQEADTLNKILQVCHSTLLGDADATTYLLNRGFDLTRLEELEFGLFKRALIDQVVPAEEQIPFGLYLDGEYGLRPNNIWDGRLIMPIRDRYGNLRALNGRDLTGTSEKKFYKTQGFNPEHLIVEGLDVAGKFTTIVLGESSMAVHSFREAGFTQMTAIGSSKFNAARWTALADIGIKSVVLWLDGDEAGRTGTLQAIEAYLQAERRPDLYIVPPVDGLDPDDMLRKQGAEAVGQMIARPVPFNTYLAEAWAKQFDISTTLGLRQYQDKAAEYLSTLDGRDAQEAWQSFYQEGVKRLTGIDDDFFFDYANDIRAKRDLAKYETKLSELKATVADATSNKDAAEVAKKLSEVIQDLKAISHRVDLKPLVRTSERLVHHDRYLAQFVGKEYIGLPQKGIPSLDAATLGLRHMTAIAAAPGAGKTTLMLQLCYDVLKNNPDTCCIIVSLEMSEEELLTRFKCRATATPYGKLLLESDQAMRERANAAIESVMARTFIIDEQVYPEVTAELLIRDIARLKSETGCKRVIVGIDYAQVYPIPEAARRGLRSENERDDWRVEELKRIRNAIAPDPLLVVSAISKGDGFKAGGLESLKGSSSFSYAADNCFVLNKITETELLSTVQLTGKTFSLKPLARGSRYGGRGRKKASELTADQEAEALELLTNEMDRQGKDFVELRIVKYRGGKMKTFILSHRHVCSDMRELTEHGESSGR
jgi:DNA primase